MNHNQHSQEAFPSYDTKVDGQRKREKGENCTQECRVGRAEGRISFPCVKVSIVRRALSINRQHHRLKQLEIPLIFFPSSYSNVNCFKINQQIGNWTLASALIFYNQIELLHAKKRQIRFGRTDKTFTYELSLSLSLSLSKLPFVIFSFSFCR